MNPEDTKNDMREQDESLSNEEALAVHEEVFRSGIPVKVDETPGEYKKRVNEMWEVEKRKLLSAQVETGGQSEDGDTLSEDVTKWLTHPKMEEYARRYSAGESMKDMLEGQEHTGEKKEAIQLLAKTLIGSSEAGDPVVEIENNEVRNGVEGSEGDMAHTQIFARAREYMDTLKAASEHPEA